VDLGALRAKPGPSVPAGGAGAPAAQEPAAPQSFAAPGAAEAATPPGAGGVVVIDVTEATFTSEVMERSMTTPVVIDFWAEWCEPCKQLSPLLEKLAVEGNGAWVLAKVDVDANQRLAQMFRVQGIPMVYAVVAGQPVDAFTGVVPEAQLRQWIDAVMRAGGAEVEVPEDPRLTVADEAMLAGDFDAAEQEYRKILAESPGEEIAEAGLAQVGLLRRVSGVDAQVALAAAAQAEAHSGPFDLSVFLLAADIEVVVGHAEEAYTRLVNLIRTTTGEERNAVRQHLLSLFLVAGPDDPAVAAARRALANALF